MFDLEAYAGAKRRIIDTELARRLPPMDTRPGILHEAMRYALFSGGKRLRPVLCLASVEAVGAPLDAALTAALAVELLHTYTLIHDDLPCMDDDALRRGKPSCHVRFGEANAVLAGDGLQALAFELAAETVVPPRYAPGRIVAELARAAGSLGVVGGQAEDMACAGRRPDAETVDFIHRHKTADLFVAAARMGAIAGNAAPKALDDLTAYATHFGLTFQLVDDLLDGGPGRADPMSSLSVFGVGEAREMARRHTAAAIECLRDLPAGVAAPLAALAGYALERKH